MEMVNTDEIYKPLICPYMRIRCKPICPGWIEVVEDCIFHVCMTEVRETFENAALFLDERLGLKPGKGEKTLRALQNVIKGQATPEELEVVRAILGNFIQNGVLSMIAGISIEKIADYVSGAEEEISFSFARIFDDPDSDDLVDDE